MNEIFISYRQDDAAAWALLLRDALVARFGTDCVYLDKDTQRAGDWKVQIRAGLARCKVVVLPIGPGWLDARTPDGARRLDLPGDVHRWEIAQALATPGVTVIPVLVGGASMPGVAELHPEIRALADLQRRELAFDAARREVDVARLVADIEGSSKLVATKTATAARGSWLDRLRLVGAAFVVTLVTLSIVDLIVGWQPLGLGEKAAVFVLLLALVAIGRRAVRHLRRSGG